VALSKLWHTLAGLYIWEFVTTLDYEWSIIRRRRPYRWTIVIYSVTRVSALIDVILSLVLLNVTTEYNCRVEFIFQLIFVYLTASAASLLIVLRVIAIWNRNKFVIAIATGIWVINLGFLIHGVVQIRSARVPGAASCTVVNMLGLQLNAIMTFIANIILLLLMLVGLLRLGYHESGVFGLGHLMWRQGLIWFFLATIVYVPAMVLITLDLNDPLMLILHLPTTVTMSITTTRIYRSLTDFSLRSTDIHRGAIIDDSIHPIDFPPSKTNRDPAQPISLEPLEVAECKTYEQYQLSRTTHHSLPTSEKGSQDDKPAGFGLDYDVETVAANRTRPPRL